MSISSWPAMQAEVDSLTIQLAAHAFHIHSRSRQILHSLGVGVNGPTIKTLSITTFISA